MWNQKNFLPSVTLVMFLYFCHSPTYAAEAPKAAPKAAEYNLVKDFCRGRRTSDDRKFCLEILKSKRKSAAVEDYYTLMKIAADAALKNAKRSIDAFNIKIKFKTIKPALKLVLQKCISTYEVVVKEYQAIAGKTEVKSSILKSNARVANDEIKGCQKVLVSSKISEPFVSNRNRIAKDYAAIVKDIAKLV